MFYHKTFDSPDREKGCYLMAVVMSRHSTAQTACVDGVLAGVSPLRAVMFSTVT